MTNAIIVPPIVGVIVAFVSLIVIIAGPTIQTNAKNTEKSLKSETSKLEPVKKRIVGKSVGLVVLCLILIILLGNLAAFCFYLSPYESIGDISKGFDDLVKDTKQKLANVDVSNMPESSLNMFKVPRHKISLFPFLMVVVEPIIEYEEYQKEHGKYSGVMRDQDSHFSTFEDFVNGLKRYTETKQCNLKVDWASDVFKVTDRISDIGTHVHKQTEAMGAFEKKLKNQMKNELQEEEKKVLGHLESTRGFFDYIQNHFQTLIDIGEKKRKSEIPTFERNIEILVVLASTSIACLVCVVTIYFIIQLLRTKTPSSMFSTLAALVYITTCQVVALCIFILFVFFACYPCKACVPPTDLDIFTMLSFAEDSTISSKTLFHSCSAPGSSLISVFGRDLLLSADSEIDDLRKKVDTSVFSETFDLIVVESNKVRALHDIMMNLGKEQTCFDAIKQQEIKKYQNIIKVLVDGGDTYRNATIKYNALNLHKHMSEAFFEQLKIHLEKANIPVNEKIKRSDFDCSTISALHSKCAKMQCPKEYSYFDEALFHLMFVILLTTILHFILLGMHKCSQSENDDKPPESSSNVEQ